MMDRFVVVKNLIKKDQNKINEENLSVVNKPSFYGLDNFVELDTAISGTLIKFVEFLKHNNIITIFVF